MREIYLNHRSIRLDRVPAKRTALGHRLTIQPNGRKLRAVHKTYTSTTKKTVKTSSTKGYTNGYIFKNGKASMFSFDGGYYSFDSQGKLNGCHYYIADYQGNNRMVVNAATNRTEQVTHYYPYGELMADISTSPDAQPFKYGDKELDRSFGLDLYDFHARQQDAKLGRFNSIDPLAEKFYRLSPYSYCGGDPVNCVDPDGNLHIFINGQHGGDGGSSEYWDGIDNTVMELTGDNSAIYIDGSCGGWLNTLLVGNDDQGQCHNNLSSEARQSSGKSRGKQMAESIYSSLGKDETIKVTTHSMGGSYGKGFVQSLVDYAKKKGIDHKIEFELDLAPFQPTEQKAVDGVPTYQASHTNDPIAGGEKIQDVKRTEINKYWNTSTNPIKPHSISTFRPEINKLLKK